jgi:hypothetical protein
MRLPGGARSIDVSVTADGIGVVYTSSGVLTGQDLLDAGARLREESTRSSGIRCLLVDHSAIPEQDVDPESVRVLSKRARATLELIRDGKDELALPLRTRLR